VGLYWGGGAGKILALFAAISAFGALNGWVLLQGEMPYAMAKGGVFPAFLAKESARGAPGAGPPAVGRLPDRPGADELRQVDGRPVHLHRPGGHHGLAVRLPGLRPGGPEAAGLAADRPDHGPDRDRLLAGVYSVWTLVGAGGQAVAWAWACWPSARRSTG
jgi:APA family basic amino acid/polyamine antiporter